MAADNKFFEPRVIKTYSALDERPDAVSFGTGLCIAGGTLYASDGSAWAGSAAGGIYLPASNTAAQNRQQIQSALNLKGKIIVYAALGSPIIIDTALIIYDDTDLQISKGIEIKMQGVAESGPLIVTKKLTDVKTAVSVTWTAGNFTASIAFTGHGLTVKDKIWLSGSDSYPFNGIFRIESVTDANNFVIRLRRLPSAAPTTQVYGVVAAKNISISGGTWNFNNSGGNIVSVAQNTHAMRLAGVSNVRVSDVVFSDTQKFCIEFGAVDDYAVNNFIGNNANSDGIHIYGPAFSGKISNVSGNFGDDVLVLHTTEAAPYLAYKWTEGDVLDFIADNINGVTATSHIAMYGVTSGLIDNVTISDASFDVSKTVFIDSAATYTGNFGTITLNNLRSYTPLVVIGANATALNIKSLVMNNCTMTSYNNVGRVLQLSANIAHTHNIIVNGGYFTGIDNLVNASGSGNLNLTLNNVNVGGCWNTFSISGTITAKINIQNITHEANPGSFWLNTAATPTVIIDADKITTPSGAQAVNKVAGATLQSLNKGWKVDLSLLARIDGAIVYNTNAALGTLAAAGVVIGQGTAANSWHLMADPTKVY